MSGRYPAPDRIPAGLYGAARQDLVVRAYERFVSGYVRASTLVHRRDVVAKPVDPSLTLVVRERRVQARDENVVSLDLMALDGRPLLPWHPGAHLDVTLPSGRRRQYSLCGDPADRRRYRIAVRRIPGGGGGSIELHDRVRVGTALRVGGPRNAFGFAVPGYGSPARRLHLIAGGIGITPILPMARLADRVGLDWSMTYTGRSRESLPFLDEIEAFGARVSVRTDDEHRLPTAAELLGDLESRMAIYCCGPAPMVSGMLVALRGVRDVEFHYERFSAPPVVNGKEFEVELASTGEVLTVPADRSALDVVRQARPDIAYSCQQGFCRTCRVRVLGGTAQHRESTLLPGEREAGDMLICVSRGDGRLVLDL
ncbi:oxidoreductase [Skermania sp. ID1734]|uniref:PDR/VanB family oxidoreductase n=1 Tax=Skermania sp. ID1734 TaxID=2597516 RepID=UPI00117D964D|nr:PDR/VanB family oxidoreductase [Skermania sp. ID1734]TSE00125.1 oxidoreductase [Skermania sp. ID1734]